VSRSAPASVEIDHIEAKIWICPDEGDHRSPQPAEFLRPKAVREISTQERRVIIAQLRSEPAEPSCRATPFDRQWENELDLAIGIAPQHDHRRRALMPADVIVPRRKPRKFLKHGAFGASLEFGPPALCRAKLSVDVNLNGRDIALRFRHRLAVPSAHPASGHATILNNEFATGL